MVHPTEMMAIIATFTVGGILLYPLVRALAKRLEGGHRRAAELPSESADRLVRMEQQMEAMAIEIERISEGQRFVTRLLSDKHAPPQLSPGQHGR